MPSLPVAGSELRIPVGRNYADHSREIGHDPNGIKIELHFDAAEAEVLEPNVIAANFARD